LPSSNRSHVCEDLTDLYLGPWLYYKK
jgi:hypothetical protein